MFPLQGVNSALEDVVELDLALSDCVDSVPTGPLVGTPGAVLERALPLFERRRLPDLRALVRIMQFGAPYQVSVSNIGARVMSSAPAIQPYQRLRPHHDHAAGI